MHIKHFTHPKVKIGDLVFHYKSYGKKEDSEKIYVVFLGKDEQFYKTAPSWAEYFVHDGTCVYRIAGNILH